MSLFCTIFAAVLGEESLTAMAVSTYFILYRPTGFVNGNLANYLKDDELEGLLVRLCVLLLLCLSSWVFARTPVKETQKQFFVSIYM